MNGVQSLERRGAEGSDPAPPRPCIAVQQHVPQKAVRDGHGSNQEWRRGWGLIVLARGC